MSIFEGEDKLVILGSDIALESSERSDSLNWVSSRLKQTGFELVAFEGYTVKANKVSLLLDRALFSGKPEQYTSTSFITKLRSEYGTAYDHKVQFSKLLGIPWYFLCYQYMPEKALLVELDLTNCRTVKSFSSIAEFGEWTETYRDMVMQSPYEESRLPRIDKILREAGIPWPGNLDTLLYHNENLLALIEFQNTVRSSVKDHCNNTWFLPQGRRKGDVNRWKALDVIRLHANLPLIIIVWSQNEPDIIKFKSVENIVYPSRSNDKAPGLNYQTKKLINFNELIQELHTLE
jgi:hypothetical protein